MTHILVTGGAGFIGSHVTAALLAADHDVSVLDSGPGEVPAGVRLHRADVRDPEAVRAALRGVDAVVHHAALVGLGVGPQDLPDYVGSNDLGTAVLLAAMAAAGVRRLVLASSMVVYGEGAYSCTTHGPVSPAPRAAGDLAAGRFEPSCPRCGRPLLDGLVGEDAVMDPRSVYAVTKLSQELLAGVWARECGASVAALRYHNVYGPGMPKDTPYSGVAAMFRSALEGGRAPRVFEDGGQRRDFVHVGDVAAANVAALRAERPGFRAYNIASGHPITIGAVAAALSEAFGGPGPVVTGEFRLGDVRHVVASPARAAAELDFRAAVLPSVGLKEFACAPLRG
ncbi:NAD-dependent dehydratase [Actinoplanes sp. SE50]|uniref:NAD-dependent epimerase/dehydratase family protein n=1 Tax=unclassified Actinoplanes TaxID=2626549 RepID=UPI00023ED469|nr:MULTISPECIES: NAD-dependent epimerase/dehydratase family protein [unclassified Actinoplanes]AEV85601.1 UDP-glucose 4-epimerase [Actinoplanes sp. SE50/110]ATO83994.1 NAD-dependent dehydratase [Actinoplanes sp. SE50]SLM01404.1 NAD-dependent dehydratase [Actinoplanes sp. SE50/110]